MTKVIPLTPLGDSQGHRLVRLDACKALLRGVTSRFSFWQPCYRLEQPHWMHETRVKYG